MFLTVLLAVVSLDSHVLIYDKEHFSPTVALMVLGWQRMPKSFLVYKRDAIRALKIMFVQ